MSYRVEWGKWFRMELLNEGKGSEDERKDITLTTD
jgi:hypothetical protein